ncbi:MAG: cation:proton antiporter [Gammaproteobacteria bacterium]|nr:MAG: cation:proton antiporter [Gammaproteobacteria bacterium]
MLIAGLMIVLCRQFKQPVVFGYIIAGMIVGPYTPPFSFISDETIINTLAELGVIFLMFSLGLEFNLHKLSKVGWSAFIAAFAEIVVMISIGYGIGLWFHWSQLDAIFLGAILAISSTTIIVKALDELQMKKEGFSQLIFGILIIEDIFAILILALLSGIAITGSLQTKDILLTATKLVSFLVVSLLAGILLVPRLLTYIAKFNSTEMLLVSVLGLCFGFCLLVVKLQYSVALGAFLIGAIIAESAQQTTIEKLILPIRDMFCAIFFVSVGLLFDPKIVVHYFVPILLITAALIVGKIISCSLAVLMTGRNGKTAMRVGMGLAQIGEFSFIIASLGIALNVTSDFLYSIAVAVSVITTLLTPYLIKYSDSFTHCLAPFVPKKVTFLCELYANWMQDLKPQKDKIDITNDVKNSLIHITISLFIILAVFLSGAYLANTEVGNFLIKTTNGYIERTVIWSIALIISLPFLITVYQKSKRISLMLIKANTKSHKFISELLPIVLLLIIMMIVSALSDSILPPIGMLIITLAIIGILIITLLPWFMALYTKLHTSLLSSLKKRKKK